MLYKNTKFVPYFYLPYTFSLASFPYVIIWF